jgi:hypothetical protein
MASVAALPLRDENAEDPGVQAPQVLVRTFAAPAGLPWDQARGALLEARHGAPLPIADLHFRVKRLERWAPGRPGRFAVFYIRRRDLTGPFETTVDVDGDPIRVAFGTSAQPSRSWRSLGVVVLAIGLSVAIVGGMAVMALSIRADASQQLDTLEQQTAAKLRAAQVAQREQAQDRALAANQGRSGQVSDVLADLTWLAHARTADARIVSVHWDHGLMAVEARGSAAPVDGRERQVVRAPKEGVAGTWLWGIGRDSPVVPANGAGRTRPDGGGP